MSEDPEMVVKQRIVGAVGIAPPAVAQLNMFLSVLANMLLCISLLFAFSSDQLLSLVPCWRSAADVALVYIIPMLLWLL